MKNNTKINPESQPRRSILLAPLDWGLGHATRCIPIIHHLLFLGYEVILAGESKQLALLRSEFPNLEFLNLPGYRLQYGHSGWKTTLKIIFQIPKILTSIKSEKRWLDGLLSEKKIDAVISDNRYGLYHPGLPCFFITHQLAIMGPFGKTGASFLRKMNYRLINQFTQCWVPDYADAVNLAGELSHPRKLPSLPVKYLGPLTRFRKEVKKQVFTLLILLSGPEPQRTLLENICLEGLKEYQEPVLMLRGLPGNKDSLSDFNRVTILNHLPSDQLNDAINASGAIISRPGYSTVMDTLGLGKACIFIPTPGQTEQVYLAAYLSRKNYCISFDQGAFSLKKALEALEKAKLMVFDPVGVEDDYRSVLSGVFSLPKP